MSRAHWLFVVALAHLTAAPARAAEETTGSDDSTLHSAVYSISPSVDCQFRIQQRLIEAVPGDVIQLSAGTFHLTQQLDVVADNLTIRGQGSSQTILSFKNQISGGQGLEATGNNLVLEGFAVQDTAGNAIKVLGARNVTFRDVRTEWTGETKASNGAYGIYPVQCSNVLIERCIAIGASDAGLYVGQCHDVIVRDSRAERNVAGIEIENTVRADVFGNLATDNAGGILVFDLPGLQVKSGRDVRVFENRVIRNNHANFAAPGNMVASVPSGTGVMIMATDSVEVFQNEIVENQSANVSIVSYLVMGKKQHDPEFDPIPQAISIHDNVIRDGGTKPSGDIAKLLKPVLGATFPDILYDGVEPSDEPLRMRIRANGNASFANFQLPMLTPENILSGKYRVVRVLDAYASQIEPLPPIELPAHDPVNRATGTAVNVYRSANRKLSQFGLFVGDLSDHKPADGVVPYDLNTPLFSDYSTKRRFIRIPKGTQITFRDEGVFEFPVGTVISKTFSYPYDMRNPKLGEHHLETRIEIRNDDGWFGFSYQWETDQHDAVLSLGGGETNVEWIGADGSQRTNRYQIPNANQCLTCHAQSKAFQPIGPTAVNMHRPFSSDYGHGDQLEYLYATKMLTGGPHNADEIPRLPVAFDSSTGSLDERARAWLDVNCAHCHNPVGTARTSGLDLRRTQTTLTKLGVWKAPVAAGHGSGGREYDIVPGHPDKSIMMYRMESSDPSVMMPNVARRLVPVEAVQLVRAWIQQMDE